MFVLSGSIANMFFFTKRGPERTDNVRENMTEDQSLKLITLRSIFLGRNFIERNSYDVTSARSTETSESTGSDAQHQE